MSERNDHPDLPANECRFSLSMSTNVNSLDGPPQRLDSHCRFPVVNTAWQICAKHNRERDRLINLFGEAQR